MSKTEAPPNKFLRLAENSIGILPELERTDAEALLKCCRRRWDQAETLGAVDDDLKLRVGRLVEVLARRSAKAIPYAALGRALLADLQGATRDRNALLLEFEMKMSMLGL